MRSPLIRDAGTILGRRESGASFFAGGDGDGGGNERGWERRGGERRRTVSLSIAAGLASRYGGFDETVGERTEEGPDGWDGHGDEDDPFFDLAPQEQDPDAVCRVRVRMFQVQGYKAGHLQDESSVRMNLAAHVRTMAATPAKIPHPMRKLRPHFSLRSICSGRSMWIGTTAR